METEIKNTVALEPRRLAQGASSHLSGPVAERTAVSASTQQLASEPERIQAASGKGQEQGVGDLQEALRDLNESSQFVKRNLQFDVDDGSGKTIIRVVDAQTDEVIRQIPSEEVVALARHLKGLSEGEQGVFLMEKA